MMNPRWTQEQAIAYECARDAITDLIGIYTAELVEENEQVVPDIARVDILEAQIAILARELTTLTVFDSERIHRIRKEVGDLVRSKRRPA